MNKRIKELLIELTEEICRLEAKCPPEAPALPTIPCPNCETALQQLVVVESDKGNEGRPYITCEACSEVGKLCFWFIDKGFCDKCQSPIYEGNVKEGTNQGRAYRVCSKDRKHLFKWAKKEQPLI